jgi:hypothetical protein
LINALKCDIPASVVDDAVKDVRQAAGPDGIDRVLEEYGIDVIIAPTESDFHKTASFSGMEIQRHVFWKSYTKTSHRVSYWHDAFGLSASQRAPSRIKYPIIQMQ